MSQATMTENLEQNPQYKDIQFDLAHREVRMAWNKNYDAGAFSFDRRTLTAIAATSREQLPAEAFAGERDNMLGTGKIDLEAVLTNLSLQHNKT